MTEEIKNENRAPIAEHNGMQAFDSAFLADSLGLEDHKFRVLIKAAEAEGEEPTYEDGWEVVGLTREVDEDGTSYLSAHIAKVVADENAASGHKQIMRSIPAAELAGWQVGNEDKGATEFKPKVELIDVNAYDLALAPDPNVGKDVVLQEEVPEDVTIIAQQLIEASQVSSIQLEQEVGRAINQGAGDEVLDAIPDIAKQNPFAVNTIIEVFIKRGKGADVVARLSQWQAMGIRIGESIQRRLPSGQSTPRAA